MKERGRWPRSQSRCAQNQLREISRKLRQDRSQVTFTGSTETLTRSLLAIARKDTRALADTLQIMRGARRQAGSTAGVAHVRQALRAGSVRPPDAPRSGRCASLHLTSFWADLRARCFLLPFNRFRQVCPDPSRRFRHIVRFFASYSLSIEKSPSHA